jgi:hypothetical protein
MTNTKAKTLADPSDEYERLLPVWRRCRAAFEGERAIKELDAILDLISFSNVLTPFSPRMTPEQYNFYRSEAEFPSVTSEFGRMIVGSLTRRSPELVLPEAASAYSDWLTNSVGQDGGTLLSFITECLKEEIQTGRGWIHVDHPVEDRPDADPYPIVLPAESVINWRVSEEEGLSILSRVVVRGTFEDTSENEAHPSIGRVITDHRIDAGVYKVRSYRLKSGEIFNKDTPFEESTPLVGGRTLNFIPIWPIGGQLLSTTPYLEAFVFKEFHLYNKMSRRNHLLYGAATYTPYVTGIGEDGFNDIISRGLGSWLRGDENTKFGVLSTPTEALADMEKAIAASIGELAKLGIRMLTPDVAESGVAIELRNSSQVARLNSISTSVSSTVGQVLAFLIFWKSKGKLDVGKIHFEIAKDFDRRTLDANLLRLATEWYENNRIPRSLWLNIVKSNEIVPTAYDDEVGREEMLRDLEDGLVNERTREE